MERKEGRTKSGHTSAGIIKAGLLLDSINFGVFWLMFEVQVWERVDVTVGWISPRLENIGSLSGELSGGALRNCFLHGKKIRFRPVFIYKN